MLILADDYTGAADAAVGLTAHGFSAAILLDPRDSRTGSEVVALDLDTRHRTMEQAEALVLDALLEKGTESFIFKKIDSTLRGHVGAELRALSKAIGERPAPMLLASAVPENGRIVAGGRVLVRGVPLEQTDVWRHERATSCPDLPARTSERLARSGLRAAEIHLGALRQGVPALKARLVELRTSGVQVVVLDSETPDDLDLVAETAASFETMPVCVGAAGLSRALGQLLGPGADDTLTPRTGLAAPVLLAIGSQSKTARTQIECLRSRGDLTVVEATGNVEGCAEQAAGALAARRHVLLSTPIAMQDGLSRDHAATVGRIVARLARRAGALIASGGDTARACLLALGYTRIEVEGELAAGVVLGHPSACPDLAFVSKAGDFGEASTLSGCIDSLTAPSRGHEP